MPSRILREGIITSLHVNTLTWPAELFYRRLFSIADDYGRYYAHPALLRSACYPLQLEKVKDSDISKWLLETEEAGLVRVYSVSDVSGAGKANSECESVGSGGRPVSQVGEGAAQTRRSAQKYLEILNFRQQTRAASKFPSPNCLSNAAHDAKHLRTKTDAGIGVEDEDEDEDEPRDVRSASGEDPANRLIVALGIPEQFGPKQLGEIRRLIGIDGYESALAALRQARSKGVAGMPALATYAARVLGGNKAKRELSSSGKPRRVGDMSPAEQEAFADQMAEKYGEK